MLIYNYKKEFLGIDEDDLKSLGLSNLTDLREEAADFADLFVKTPGFIHNFEHVHWIDYITCSLSGVESKAVIHVKNKNYTTAINIQTIYLVDSPSKKAYIVNLSNIRPLSNTETQKISAALLGKAKPQTCTEPIELLTVANSVIHTEQSAHEHKDIDEPSSDLYTLNHEQEIHEDEPLQIDLSLDEPSDITQEILPLEEKFHETVKEIEEVVEVEKNDAYANYVFDPNVASQELNLSIDLVEEFIEDFITQANSFKDGLYKSVKSGDFNNLKIDSNKLKSVAINLRVEDALDALTIIDNSNSEDKILKNLDRLYKIIEKLSKKDNTLAKLDNNTQKKAEEEFVLSLKDDEPKTQELSPAKDDLSMLAEDIDMSQETADLQIKRV